MNAMLPKPTRPDPPSPLPLTDGPAPTESEELLHSLRNVLAAMTYGLQAISDVHTRGNEQEFNELQVALTNQLDRLKDAVDLAARLLEPPRAASVSSD